MYSWAWIQEMWHQNDILFNKNWIALEKNLSITTILYDLAIGTRSEKMNK